MNGSDFWVRDPSATFGSVIEWYETICQMAKEQAQEERRQSR